MRKKQKIKDYLFEALTEKQKKILYKYIDTHFNLTKTEKAVAKITLIAAHNSIFHNNSDPLMDSYVTIG